MEPFLPFVVYIWLRYDTPELRERYPQPLKVPVETVEMCRKIANAYIRTNRRAVCYRAVPQRINEE